MEQRKINKLFGKLDWLISEMYIFEIRPFLRIFESFALITYLLIWEAVNPSWLVSSPRES